MSAFLLALIATTPSPAVPVAEAAFGADEPALRLWVSSDRRFREGERARVQVETRDDGFLLVLQLDTDGRVNVLFPLDPGDDNFVRGGRRYEVRSERDNTAFTADRGGQGLVYSAISPDPYRFDAVLVGGAWDYGVLRIDPQSRDPEQELNELVQKLASQRGFDYDILGYTVYGTETYVVQNTYVDPYIYDPDRCYPTIGYRSRCYDGYWPRTCFGCPYFGRTGLYIGIGLYDPWFYDPWYYRYGYGYGNGYGRGYGYPYGGFGRGPIVVHPRGDTPVIRGRPRGFTVGRYDDRPSGPQSVGTARGAGGFGDGIDYRGRARPRPANDATPARSPATSPAARPASPRSRGGRPEGAVEAPRREPEARPARETGRDETVRRSPSVVPSEVGREVIVPPARPAREEGPGERAREEAPRPRYDAPAPRGRGSEPEARPAAERTSPPARRARERDDSDRQAVPATRREDDRRPFLERRNPPPASRDGESRPAVRERPASPPPAPPAQRPSAKSSPPPPPPASGQSGQSRSRRRPA